jgi:zinc transporter ZupT
LGKIKPTAWMLLLSDTIHNCADGLAIGASFANSNSQGIATSIAIICHEIPHELGNYAVLINCGFTHVQAVLANFMSACASFIGFYVAASVSSDETVSQWIFSITAGMFYYISLVDLVRKHLPFVLYLPYLINVFLLAVAILAI